MSVISKPTLEKMAKRLSCGLEPENAANGDATAKSLLAAFMAYCASAHGVELDDTDILQTACKIIGYPTTPHILEKLRSALRWMRANLPNLQLNTKLQPNCAAINRKREENYTQQIIEYIRNEANAPLLQELAREKMLANKRLQHSKERHRKVNTTITNDERQFFYAIEMRVINECPITSLNNDPRWEKLNIALELIALRTEFGRSISLWMARELAEVVKGEIVEPEYAKEVVKFANKLESHFFEKQMPESCLKSAEKKIIRKIIKAQQAEKEVIAKEKDKIVIKGQTRYKRKQKAEVTNEADISRQESYRVEQEKIRHQRSSLNLYVAHKVRLAPNNLQKTYLKKCFGISRLCFNWAYDQWKAGRYSGEHFYTSDLRTQFKEINKKQYPFTFDVTSNAKASGFRAFDRSQEALFNHCGFPNRKKKGIGLGSLRFSMEHDKKRPFISDVNLDIEGAKPSAKRQYLNIPGLGYVKMMEKLRFNGMPSSAVVKLESDGHYYAVIRVRIDKREWNNTHPDIGFITTEPLGIDVGISSAATFSNGIKAIAPTPSTALLNRIKRLKKQVNRDRASLKRNTKNKKRRAWMLAKAKARRARIQENFQQKLTSVIAKMYKNVSIENLNIVPMINSYAQPGVIIKAAFYRFRLLLEQKMEYGERILHEADKALPSTRTCSVCGCVGPKVPLKERTFHCKECGAEIDRDLNAAINLARLIGLDEPEFKSAAADALNAALLRNGIETRQVVAESR